MSRKFTTNNSFFPKNSSSDGKKQPKKENETSFDLQYNHQIFEGGLNRQQSSSHNISNRSICPINKVESVKTLDNAMIEAIIEKTIKTVKKEIESYDYLEMITEMSVQAEYNNKRLYNVEESIKSQTDNILLDINRLSRVIMGTSDEQRKQLQETRREESEEIKNLKQFQKSEMNEFNQKLEVLQKSMKDMTDEMKNLNSKVDGLYSLYSELKFKGNPPPPSKLKTLYNSILGKGKETPIKEETCPAIYSTMSFSIFPNSGYEKATDQLIEIIRSQCNSDQCYLNCNFKSKIDEYESGENVLFIRYCGSTRFESPDASALSEKGCKIFFILFTYGDKTKDIVLPSQFQNCPFMQIAISGIYYHNTQDLIGMDEQKQNQLMDMLTNCFHE